MARRPSSILRLPPELVRELNAQIADGRMTVDELTAFVRERAPEANISRSAVGRHKVSAERTLKRVQEAQEVAGTIVKELKADSQGDVTRLLSELLKTLAYKTLGQMTDDEDEGGGGGTIDAQSLSFLARAIKDISSADKTNIERLLKTRDAWLNDQRKKDQGALDRAVKAGEIDAEAAAKARRAMGFAT